MAITVGSTIFRRGHTTKAVDHLDDKVSYNMAMVQMLECHEEIFGEIDSSDGEDVELYEQLRVADEKYSFKNRA